MKMSFTPDELAVTIILQHQDELKAAGKRHTRSDAINGLINDGRLLQLFWIRYGKDIKAVTLSSGREFTPGYILDAVYEKMQRDGYTPTSEGWKSYLADK